MKRTLLFLLIAAAGTLTAPAQSSLSEAQHAFVTGDIATAKDKFKIILAADPRNVVARNYLKMIAASEAKEGSSDTLTKQLSSLILPNVDFKEATLDAALDFLRQKAATVSDGKIKTSFVLQPGVNGSAVITLHLTNVPFTEVLRYVGQLADAEFVIEQYAIAVKPKSKAASAPAAGTAQ